MQTRETALAITTPVMGLVQLDLGGRTGMSERDFRALRRRTVGRVVDGTAPTGPCREQIRKHHRPAGERWLAPAAALVCSAVLDHLGTGLAPVAALTWLAP